MVRIIFWNSQGTLGLVFHWYLKLLIQTQSPDIFAIFEPRVSGAKADGFIRKSGFDHSFRVEANGFWGGIWVLWRDTVSMDFLVASNQFSHGLCGDSGSSRSFFISFVYARPVGNVRKNVWNQLRTLEPNNNKLWVLGGEFNALCGSYERNGGSPRRSVDMGFNGPRYTGQSRNLCQRLDRWSEDVPDDIYRPRCSRLWMGKDTPFGD
ncbi:uncharacterized protein LOC120216309 [Hibiscus syriacus]|uniref:uncharacterized protein LOC120216309 n=1 Tax=Hibiscus syriacus TaxID=106335 RepID=UPI001920705A|nr:uncharacterized protein LOC120216309 [Hibiscus syriacus]